MSVTRIMGIETEYGITTPGRSTMNAMVASSDVVTAYGRHGMPPGRRMASWDYDRENPLRDARGYDMSISEADPTQLTNEDLGLANVILTNGGRLYVDHAHPEYSTPEVTNPRDAVLWDRCGVEIMRRAMQWVAATPGANPVVLYKNNTDNKGASYGCHENYLVRRTTPFADIVRHLIPFFITRQIFTGTGRVGLEQDGRSPGFQLSQRADFFEVDVGLETTLKRPIINTRDEPHADPEKWRRLHVIVGDANLSDVATFLKVGTTAIVLSMIEDGWLNSVDWLPLHPVAEMHAVSHDHTLTHRLELSGGRRWSALELQYEILGRAREYCERRSEDPDPDQTHDVLSTWQRILDTLTRAPLELASEIDWVAKFRLMNGYIARDRLTWEAPTLAAIDLQYSDIRPEKGLALRLEQAGHLTRLTSDAEVSRAVHEPPSDTRAYFRGECIRRFPESVSAASWDSIVLDLPSRESLMRVPTIDPLRGTREHVGSLLDNSSDVDSLVKALEASA